MKSITLKGRVHWMVVFLSLWLNSCGGGGDSESSLSISVSNKNSYLIDASGSTCLDLKSTESTKSASSYYFTFNKPVFSWSDTEKDVYIAYVKIKFESPALSGGNFECVFAGDSLSSLYQGTNILVWNDGKIAKASSSTNPSTIESDCYLRCGGVSLADKDAIMTATGTIQAVGYTQDADGNQAPVKASTTVTIEAGL